MSVKERKIRQRDLRWVYRSIDTFPSTIILLKQFQNLKDEEYLTYADIRDKLNIRPTSTQWILFRKAFGRDMWGNGCGFIEGIRGSDFAKTGHVNWFVVDKEGLDTFLDKYSSGEY